ncbi:MULTISPECIES: ATPase [unclassified Vibrio]|uniref:ATPase n=1 Tax=unclassified Vibrio TaxID=2614977 RepID=UPI000B8E2890|nr:MULTISPECIES: ATPase [unclassified Vibrio]NAX44348.1 ATPase [Vibrio sp. V25_P4S6T154]OXX44892.1 ATPase [Vibrio sp. V17_P4S1T151]OXX62643.1 ATPase [Vibrio sp. V15_P4S5T153]OXX66775.1 ATPase [Vibrio sp. V20_P4S3T152]
MQLDTRSAIDGAIRGFQVAEGYYQRQADNERRDKLDAREEQRYQDGQARLSQIEAKNDKRYQDGIEYRNAQTEKEEQRYQDNLKREGEDRAQRNRLLDVQIDAHKSAKELSQYQLNQQKKMTYMQENLPLIQSGLKRYMETGELDPLFEQEHIKGSAYDPRRYTPRVVQAAFDIESTMPKVLDGSISYKDSQFTKSMGVLLERNVKQGIGDKDPESGKVIKDKEYLRHDFVADIDPNREGDQPGVVVGLKVTYEDGTTKTAPVTESRLAGSQEAIKVIPLDALMKDVTGQIHMAKQFFTNDHYANLFNVGDAKSRTEIDKQWREAVTELEKDRTAALNDLLEPTPEQISVVNARFDERKSMINQVYGRLGENQSNREVGNAAQKWAGEDPQKRQFINELSQSMNLTELTPEALEHNYQRVLTIKANHEAELKKQQQLERLRQSQQSQKIYEDSGGYGAAQPTDNRDAMKYGSHSLLNRHEWNTTPNGELKF